MKKDKSSIILCSILTIILCMTFFLIKFNLTNEITSNEGNRVIQRSSDVYYCYNQSDIEEAISSIGTGEGIIILANETIELTSTINLDGGGNYTIMGQSNEVVINCTGDISAFAITNVTCCKLENFNVNAFQLSEDRFIIFINETNHNEIIMNDISIIGNDKSGEGVRISSGNTMVKSCRFSELNISIYISGGNDTKVMNSNFSNNFGCLVILGWDDDSFDNQIKNNVFTSSMNCISIAGFYYYTGFNNISGNVIKNFYTDTIISNGIGISLMGTYNNTISRNSFINNVNYNDHSCGVIYSYSTCSNNTITDNIIVNNSNSYPGQECYGILMQADWMGNEGDNLIYNNTIMGNDQQAYDSYDRNSWNNTEMGNFWGDYTGVDSDFDGIGDIPYTVTGGKLDYLPIWNSEIELIVPTNGSNVSQYPQSFSVLFHDLNVNSTWYSLDGGITNYSFTGVFIIDAQAWASLWEEYNEGDPITITFYFNTTYGYTVSKTFILYGSFSNPPVPPDYTLLIIGIVIGVVSIAGLSTILIIRNKIKNRPQIWTQDEDLVEGTVSESENIEYYEED